MLKLTYSFSRYIVTCKNVSYRAHSRNFVHLSSNGKTCSRDSVLTTSVTYVVTGNQLRLLATNRNIKLPIKNIKAKERKTKPMSEFQPSLNTAFYGGSFEVSNENITNDWEAQFGSGSSYSSGIRSPCRIPTNFRVWEEVGSSNGSQHRPSFKFRVLSYNVLAQSLLEGHPYLYRGCARDNLRWEVRAPRIFEEIIKLEPAIICLQEVQASHLESFYRRFEQHGYAGIFKQRTGHRTDGCAIYYRQDLFEKADQCSVEYYQPKISVLSRDNIGIMVKLVPRCMPSQPLVVATTHLLYNPKREDVRLAQIQLLLAEIDRFAYNRNKLQHMPIILTGDLNSAPDSAVIQLLDEGYVRAAAQRNVSDWKRIGVTDNCQHLAVVQDRTGGRPAACTKLQIQHSEFSKVKQLAQSPEWSDERWRMPALRSPEYAGDDPAALQCGLATAELTAEGDDMFNSGALTHSLKLTSVYGRRKEDGTEEGTTFQNRWITVDYMYYSSFVNLKLVQRLRLPTVTECHLLGHLPNDVYASDHLALAAMFEIKAPSG